MAGNDGLITLLDALFRCRYHYYYILRFMSVVKDGTVVDLEAFLATIAVRMIFLQQRLQPVFRNLE